MIRAFFDNGWAEYRKVEELRLRVKSTWDMYRMSRPTWNEDIHGHPLRLTVLGLPDVWRIRPRDVANKPDIIELTADRQHYLLKCQLDVFRNRAHSKAEYFAWYESKTPEVYQFVQWMTSACTHFRSHTNYHGLDNKANFLTGERLNEGLPKFAQLVTGWFVAKPNGQVRTLLGVPHIGFHCIDASEDYWKFSPITHRWLYDQPCSTGRTIEYTSGGAKIGRDDLHKPYPQFDNRLVFPVWLPSDSVAFIPQAQASMEAAPYGKRWTAG